MSRRKSKNLAARNRLRTELAACGVPPAEIASAVERLRFEQLVAHHGLEGARAIVYREVKTLDDKGYRPTRRDPLLHGPARATGATARAVRRRSTYAQWQLEGDQ